MALNEMLPVERRAAGWCEMLHSG